MTTSDAHNRSGLSGSPVSDRRNPSGNLRYSDGSAAVRCPTGSSARGHSAAGDARGPETVSVVLPNFNHARFLPLSLGGILRQSRPADEIIIIDDASTDNSIKVIEEAIAGQPNARLIRRQRRAGVIANLNLGLSEATGSLITLVGADDMVFPTFLRRTSSLLAANPQAGFAAGCAELWNEAQKTLGFRPSLLPSVHSRAFSAEEFRQLLRSIDNFIVTPVALYRRAALLELGGFDEALGSACDGVLARRVAARHGFVFVPEVLGVWRITGANYSVNSLLEPPRFQRMLTAVDQAIESEPPGLFPKDYRLRLKRRLQFGGAGLVSKQCDLSEATALIWQYLGRRRVDSAALRLIRFAGPFWRAAAQVWLFVRLWPFPPHRVLFDFLRWRTLRKRSEPALRPHRLTL